MDTLADPTLVEVTWTSLYSKAGLDTETKQPPAPVTPTIIQSCREQLAEICIANADFLKFVILRVRDTAQLLGTPRIPAVISVDQALPDSKLLPYGPKDLVRFLNHLGSDILKTAINDQVSFPSICSGLVFLVDDKFSSSIKLRNYFVELNPTLRQVGLDDRVIGSFAALSHGFLERNLNRVIEIAKRGLHDADRPLAWSLLLGVVNVTGDTVERVHGSPLALPAAADVGEGLILYTDLLLQADVLDTCTDEHHFLFQDSALRLLSCFINSSIQWGSDTKPTSPTLQTTSGDTIPASGILPFKGISSYVSPILYLYKEEDALPHLHILYKRYYCRLHTIEGLAPLVGLAELLIAEGCPALITKFKTLQSQDPDISLCSAIVPWLMSGFAGYIMPREYFQLWDRVLGYDSLELLAVFAAAIMVLKSNIILNLNDPQDMAYYLLDLSGIQTVPLLQLSLFSKD